jgi:hypothetical protein
LGELLGQRHDLVGPPVDHVDRFQQRRFLGEREPNRLVKHAGQLVRGE